MPRDSAAPRLALLAALGALACQASTSIPPPGPGPQPAVSVTVTPSSASVPAGARRTFTAVVTGGAAGVTWTVQEGSPGGTVTAAGVYTAPSGAGGTYHVVATSVADPAHSASATVAVAAAGTYLTPGTLPATDVAVAVDTHPAGSRRISPWIYGLNYAESSVAGGASDGGQWGTRIPAGVTLNRHGGNSLSAINWETGNYNAGRDWGYHNQGGGTGLGAGSRSQITYTFGRMGRPSARAMLETLPILGFVAADQSDTPLPATTTTVAIPTVPSRTSIASSPDPSRFKASSPGRAGDPAHALATAAPSTTDGAVYQDDFLKWLDTTFPGHAASETQPFFLSMDNEPDIWGLTHAELRGQLSNACANANTSNPWSYTLDQCTLTPFDEVVTRNLDYARTVKALMPAAKVFGLVTATWDGLQALGHQGTAPAGYQFYYDYYLDQVKAAETAAGHKLVDVLDFHWYPSDVTNVCRSGEAGCWGASITHDDQIEQWPSLVDAREQAPRSLWDPSYLENSWVMGSIPGCYWNCGLRLLPRLQASIDGRNPGTGLAITEYWYGRMGDISGGIAQADVLGIFAKYGVFAATPWKLGNVWAYNQDGGCNAPGAAGHIACKDRSNRCFFAAYDAYTDYDGTATPWGDTYVETAVADADRPVDPGRASQTLERVTSYAAVNGGDSSRVVVVAINKSQTAALTVGVRVTHDALLGRAEVYRVTGVNGGNGGCTGPARAPDLALAATNAFTATLPAQSITVFVLRQ